MIANTRIVALLLAAIVSLNAAATEQPESETEHPLKRHLARILTGDNTQWRTPNPDYQEGGKQPAEFGLRLRLMPDQRHATGELTGVYGDGREALYWSLLAFYNPVTEQVILQQIGWDGTLLRGEVAVQPGQQQVIDMTLFAASGEMKRTRHEMNFVTTDMHLAKAYEYSAGRWQLQQQSQWRRHKTQAAQTSNHGSGAVSGNQTMIARDVAHLLSGSGQWRAPNPDYAPEGTMPREFGMNYRWGPHGQHVVAEIISIYADGRQAKDWSLYIIHNPVLGVTTLEQTGQADLYFRGRMGEAGDGEHVETGLIFFGNGTVKSVRDRNVMLDRDTRLARVDERDDNGAWRQVREWTWKQQPAVSR